MSDRTTVVAVIGGGASGTLAAVYLLREAAAARVPLRIAMIDRNGRHGLGQAYATSNAAHLLNSRADRMSAVAGDAGHLVRWAAARGITRDGFLPRQAFGRYLSELLADAERSAGPAATVSRITSDVVALTRGGLHRPVRLHPAARRALPGAGHAPLRRRSLAARRPGRHRRWQPGDGSRNGPDHAGRGALGDRSAPAHGRARGIPACPAATSASMSARSPARPRPAQARRARPRDPRARPGQPPRPDQIRPGCRCRRARRLAVRGRFPAPACRRALAGTDAGRQAGLPAQRRPVLGGAPPPRAARNRRADRPA